MPCEIGQLPTTAISRCYPWVTRSSGRSGTSSPSSKVKVTFLIVKKILECFDSSHEIPDISMGVYHDHNYIQWLGRDWQTFIFSDDIQPVSYASLPYSYCFMLQLTIKMSRAYVARSMSPLSSLRYIQSTHLCVAWYFEEIGQLIAFLLCSRTESLNHSISWYFVSWELEIAQAHTLSLFPILLMGMKCSDRMDRVSRCATLVFL